VRSVLCVTGTSRGVRLRFARRHDKGNPESCKVSCYPENLGPKTIFKLGVFLVGPS
jgi:hypothetical protein